MFIRALVTIAKMWKHPECPSMDKWIKKDVVNIHNGILFSLEKEGYLPICYNMDGPWEHYAKPSNSNREDKDCMISIICGI